MKRTDPPCPGAHHTRLALASLSSLTALAALLLIGGCGDPELASESATDSAGDTVDDTTDDTADPDTAADLHGQADAAAGLDSGVQPDSLADASADVLGGDADAGAADTPDATDTVDAGPPHAQDDVLRLNHVQFKGTHNSYHIKPDIALLPWDYTHAPLLEQFEKQGVRQIELDIYWNVLKDDYDVLHVHTLDGKSTCATLTICLEQVRKWLAKRPGALPVQIWLEPKDLLDLTLSKPAFDKLESIIRAVKWPKGLIEPDDVRGSAKDLITAVTAAGWPTLSEVRGKAMFVLLDSGVHRDAYVKPDPTLKGRALFAEGSANDPWGAMAKIDGPIGGQAAIQAAVKAGRMIRTRADSDSAEAKKNDKTRLQAALDSGAQAISTDYPAKIAKYDYVVEIPGGTPARCNPVTAPPSCVTKDVEQLQPMALSEF